MNFPSVFAVVLGLAFSAPFAEAAPDQPGLDLLPPEARSAVAEQLARAGENARALDDAIAQAPPEQRSAVAFLVANMPETDLKALGKDYLLTNVRLAYLARAATPWGLEDPRGAVLRGRPALRQHQRAARRLAAGFRRPLPADRQAVPHPRRGRQAAQRRGLQGRSTSPTTPPSGPSPTRALTSRPRPAMRRAPACRSS